MTARPSPKPRPVSAIYIGPNPSPTHLPELPEPPSPGSSSGGSGLPSPPATNSTGSGSTGDNSNNGTNVRQKSQILSSTNMLNGTFAKSSSDALAKSPATTRIEEEQSNDIDDDDEDHTARLSRQSRQTANENVLALQRVRSLTQRNRMALDKLSAYSRLSTPSPTRNLRSPALPAAASSSASSSSKSSSQSHTRSQSHAQPAPLRRQDSMETVQSGSETERESQHTLYTAASYASSSEDLPEIVPPSSTRPQSSLGVYRHRHTSAPTSPEKAITRAMTSSPTRSRTPARTFSKSASYNTPSEQHPGQESHETSAALATVASSRRSPTGGSGKRRSALPRDFRDRSGSLDHGTVGDSSVSNSGRTPSSSRAHISFANLQNSPPRTRQDRQSGREPFKRHQTRWQSEDHGSSIRGEDVAEEPSTGRRQSRRSGSIDNILGDGRSLISQGLKAAGILKKDDDPFAPADHTLHTRRKGSIDWAAEVRADHGHGRERERERSQNRPDMHSNGREHADTEPPDPTEGHSRALVSRNMHSDIRPATSMANYHVADGDSQGQIEVARAGSVLGNYSTSLQPRPVSAMLGATKFSPGSSAQQQAEHTRLMMESLSMFESQLSRVPPLGNTSTATIPELFRSAQTIVQASEKLNTQLRAGTVRALEEQIDAEVGQSDEPGVDLVAVWRKIGGDYRENLRVSDELVRTMTGFLLGVGKVLRETVALSGSAAGDSVYNGRSASMDQEGLRRNSPDVGGSVHSSERRNAEERSASRSESRRSWEPRGEQLRRFSTRVDGILASIPRPSSALRNQGQDREHEILSPAMTGNSQTIGSSAVRRLFAPREHREEQFNASTNSFKTGVGPSDSQESFDNYEPSPTPASRQHHKPGPLLNRSHNLPPLTVPSPSPALPSESSNRAPRNDTQNLKTLHDRRKISAPTVRPSPIAFPGLALPNPTTAITAHTVSNSPEAGRSSLMRSNSATSSRNNVTFSKPSTISVSALTGLQQQHSQQIQRTISSSSAASSVSHNRSNGKDPATPLSGSETERDIRRRTLGSKSVRASLDGALYPGLGGAGGGSQRLPILNASKKERRKTLTEIFSQG